MIIAVDFDGTLCEEKYPDIGRPIWRTINLVKTLHKVGHTIILNTCRVHEYLDNALTWCHNFEIPIDLVNENAKERQSLYGIDCRKISADIYIDDKAINLREPTNLQKLITSLSKTGLYTMTAASYCETCLHHDVCKYKEENILTHLEMLSDESPKAFCEHYYI